MATNTNRGNSKGAGKATQNGAEMPSNSPEKAASQREASPEAPVVLPPPPDSLLPKATAAAGAAKAAKSHGVPTRKRGRRKIRERAQVRARLDELAGKLERGEIDVKAAAIMVQSFNGILACLNSEAGEAIEKRVAALEARQPAQRAAPRGAEA